MVVERGSLKSSTAFLYSIFNLTRDAQNGEITHCVALRKVKDTIRGSIFQNFLWAIDKLQLNNVWDYTISPMRIFHPNGNEIVFRGCANQKDFEKIKSIKFEKGYCKIIVFEEWPEFSGMDETMSIIQSVLRGGDKGIAFYMYNPSASKTNWVNEEVRKPNDNRIIHTSNYLQAPQEWLGKIFLDEAENCKKNNPRKYRHMYGGEEIGEGLEIYPPYDKETGEGLVEYRPITDKEIELFTKVNRGLDFGYSHNTHYSETYYDKLKDWVYIYDEVSSSHLSNKMIAELIIPKAGNKLIIADSEDPRTINEMRLFDLNIIGCRKGKDSKYHGIKWMQDRSRIIIDPKRCPNTTSEFQTYEYKKDKEGKKILDYPDEPDSSASSRYSLEPYILNSKMIIV
jgi:phage terminase large subunit